MALLHLMQPGHEPELRAFFAALSAAVRAEVAPLRERIIARIEAQGITDADLAPPAQRVCELRGGDLGLADFEAALAVQTDRRAAASVCDIERAGSDMAYSVQLAHMAAALAEIADAENVAALHYALLVVVHLWPGVEPDMLGPRAAQVFAPHGHFVLDMADLLSGQPCAHPLLAVGDWRAAWLAAHRE